jgi:dihydroorotase
MTVVDFNSRFTVCPDMFLSRGKSTPFEGLELAGVVKATVAAGKIVYEENAEK